MGQNHSENHTIAPLHCWGVKAGGVPRHNIILRDESVNVDRFGGTVSYWESHYRTITQGGKSRWDPLTQHHNITTSHWEMKVWRWFGLVGQNHSENHTIAPLHCWGVKAGWHYHTEFPNQCHSADSHLPVFRHKSCVSSFQLSVTCLLNKPKRERKRESDLSWPSTQSFSSNLYITAKSLENVLVKQMIVSRQAGRSTKGWLARYKSVR